MSHNDQLTIMVSSTVYGIEDLLDRIYALLVASGYRVWMSHKGTIFLASNRTAFENCLAAVANCDLFLGLITPRYGSGQRKYEISTIPCDLGCHEGLARVRNTDAGFRS